MALFVNGTSPGAQASRLRSQGRHPQTSMGLNSATSFPGFIGLPTAASQDI
jgi:hypothetical protein